MFCAVEAGIWQIGLTQGRACDCERVDRIRLAVGTGAVADVRLQFRRDANYSFAGVVAVVGLSVVARR